MGIYRTDEAAEDAIDTVAFEGLRRAEQELIKAKQRFEKVIECSHEMERVELAWICSKCGGRVGDDQW